MCCQVIAIVQQRLGTGAATGEVMAPAEVERTGLLDIGHGKMPRDERLGEQFAHCATLFNLLEPPRGGQPQGNWRRSKLLNTTGR
jgi:hypothetical protein